MKLEGVDDSPLCREKNMGSALHWLRLNFVELECLVLVRNAGCTDAVVVTTSEVPVLYSVHRSAGGCYSPLMAYVLRNTGPEQHAPRNTALLRPLGTSLD